MMESEFQMSMMGELTFFLGIQVKQMKKDTFVHQSKYTKDLMKKFNMAEIKLVSTLMSSGASLGPDEDGEAVDQREYRSMTRLDIQFAVGLCMCFQAFPCSSHRTIVQ
jgi:isopentenyldiphosphate isomerase